jgi:hypothetical protein
VPKPVQRTGFLLEEGHKYFHEDDVQGSNVVDFDSSKYAFRSPTGLIKDFHEEFDTISEAKKYVKHKLATHLGTVGIRLGHAW